MWHGVFTNGLKSLIMEKLYTIDLEKVGLSDVELVGGKNASLGEMLSGLSNSGIKVPDGFAVTVKGYWAFICTSGLKERIDKCLFGIDYNDLSSLAEGGGKIRKMILECEFPLDLKKEILAGFKEIQLKYLDKDTGLAVRSSATAEDLPNASFAGQQETFLNVRGEKELLESIKKCFASLYTNRAISYRFSNGFHGKEVALSVTIQRMVRSDVGVSGVAFSMDTESGFKDAVIINGAYGLGELLVQGAISPDEFIVHKGKLKEGFDSILEKKLGSKEKMLMYSRKPGVPVEELITPPVMKMNFCLSDAQVIRLAKWVSIIEDYYSQKYGKWCPVDVEWAIDGNTKELYVVQARPETVRSQENPTEFKKFSILTDASLLKSLVNGIAVGDGVGQGKLKVYKDTEIKVSHVKDFTEGDVLVTDMTDPDWEPIMKKASAIITNKGGRTCHAAIVARELGVPAIVGTGNATEVLFSGKHVTVSCCEGADGKVYKGLINFKEEVLDLNSLPDTDTKVMLNVGSPDLAFKYANIPNKGVGLARQEFIFNTYVKVHPLALMNHNDIGDPVLSAEIKKIIVGYDNEYDYFIQKLSQGISKIAAAFSPNNVILRLSDFKSNEYASLLGGNYYEPNEENPMIGWRGASRYYSEDFIEAFKIECEAIARVRNVLGFENLSVMIPFCRTVDECEKVIKIMSDFGLKRGENGLKIYLMAEVPSNIILAEEFAKHIDGFSIGSNDLTQLTLGLDRDSGLISHLFDENNPAVKEMIRMLIEKSQKAGVTVGICGQAPSDHPQFAEFLVREGINSISVTPDSLFRTIKSVAKIEDELKSNKLNKAA